MQLKLFVFFIVFLLVTFATAFAFKENIPVQEVTVIVAVSSLLSFWVPEIVWKRVKR